MNITELEQIRTKLDEDVVRLKGLRERVEEGDYKLKSLKVRILKAEKAKTLAQDVATRTQKNLEFHISHLVTLAIASVFPDPVTFIARMVPRRGKTECDLLFNDHGNECSPEDNSGGGVLDITSFALRVCEWSLKKNRPVLILDEPFRNLSANFHSRASEMIKMISDKLGLQIIMNSHQEDINTAADRTFTVTKENGESRVKQDDRTASGS